MKRSVKTNEMIIADDDFDIADYPACKAFFPVTEGSGNIITDLVNDVVVDYSVKNDGTTGFSSIAWSGNKITRSSEVGNAGYVTSANKMPNVGSTDNFMCLAVVDDSGSTDQLVFGGGATEFPNVQLYDTLNILNVVNSGAAASAEKDSFAADAGRDINTKVVAVYSDRTNNKWYYVEGDGTTITSPENMAIVNATGTMDFGEDVTSGLFMIADNILYGAAIFQFTGDPDHNDMLAIASWCNVQWRAGNKVLPPWLKNRA